MIGQAYQIRHGESSSGVGPGKELWSVGDHAQAARLVHGLRGSVASMGARRFTAKSSALERDLVGDASGCAVLFAEAEVELSATLGQAQLWLEAGTALQ